MSATMTNCPLCGGEHEAVIYFGVKLYGCPEVPEGVLVARDPSASFSLSSADVRRMAVEADRMFTSAILNTKGHALETPKGEQDSWRVLIAEDTPSPALDEFFGRPVTPWPCDNHLEPYMNAADRETCEICTRPRPR